MKNLGKKFLGIALATASIATMAISSVYAGAENDYAYKFKVSSYHNNEHCDISRHRQTADPGDRWKVKLSTSAEGTGTYTRFWLENYDEDNVSQTVDVKQGVGYYYRPSYNSGCKTYVWLTAENNNYNSDSYEVSGYWDEETGVFYNK